MSKRVLTVGKLETVGLAGMRRRWLKQALDTGHDSKYVVTAEISRHPKHKNHVLLGQGPALLEAGDHLARVQGAFLPVL